MGSMWHGPVLKLSVRKKLRHRSASVGLHGNLASLRGPGGSSMSPPFILMWPYTAGRFSDVQDIAEEICATTYDFLLVIQTMGQPAALFNPSPGPGSKEDYVSGGAQLF